MDNIYNKLKHAHPITILYLLLITVSFLFLTSLFLSFSSTWGSLRRTTTTTKAEDQQTDEQSDSSSDNLPLEQQQNIQVTVKIINKGNGETRFPSAIVGLKWCKGDSLDCTKIESSSAQQVYSDPTDIDQMTPSFTINPKDTSSYTTPTLRAYLEAGKTRYSKKITKLCDSVIFIETDKKISSIEPECTNNPGGQNPTPTVPAQSGDDSIIRFTGKIINKSELYNLNEFNFSVNLTSVWNAPENINRYVPPFYIWLLGATISVPIQPDGSYNMEYHIPRQSMIDKFRQEIVPYNKVHPTPIMELNFDKDSIGWYCGTEIELKEKAPFLADIINDNMYTITKSPNTRECKPNTTVNKDIIIEDKYKEGFIFDVRGKVPYQGQVDFNRTRALLRNPYYDSKDDALTNTFSYLGSSRVEPDGSFHIKAKMNNSRPQQYPGVKNYLTLCFVRVIDLKRGYTLGSRLISSEYFPCQSSQDSKTDINFPHVLTFDGSSFHVTLKPGTDADAGNELGFNFKKTPTAGSNPPPQTTGTRDRPEKGNE